MRTSLKHGVVKSKALMIDFWLLPVFSFQLSVRSPDLGTCLCSVKECLQFFKGWRQTVGRAQLAGTFEGHWLSKEEMFFSSCSHGWMFELLCKMVSVQKLFSHFHDVFRGRPMSQSLIVASWLVMKLASLDGSYIHKEKWEQVHQTGPNLGTTLREIWSSTGAEQNVHITFRMYCVYLVTKEVYLFSLNLSLCNWILVEKGSFFRFRLDSGFCRCVSSLLGQYFSWLIGSTLVFSTLWSLSIICLLSYIEPHECSKLQILF